MTDCLYTANACGAAVCCVRGDWEGLHVVLDALRNPVRIDLLGHRDIAPALWADIERVGSEILSRIQPLTSPQLLVDLCALSYMGSAQVALVVRMFKPV